MQFQVLAFVAAAMASVATAAETVTVYACPTSTAVTSGVAAPTTVASTGVVTAPTPTGSPIFTGAGSVNGVSAFGMVVAGGVAALFI